MQLYSYHFHIVKRSNIHRLSFPYHSMRMDFSAGKDLPCLQFIFTSSCYILSEFISLYSVSAISVKQLIFVLEQM